MASNFIVNEASIKQKAEELKSQNANLKSQIDNLVSQQSALNGMWEGDAKQAFDIAFKNDVIQMNNFHDLIDRYVAALLSIAAKYADAESRNLNTATTRNYK